MESAQMHKAGTHKYPPRRQSGYTSDPHSASSSPATTGSASTPLFISINRTHTHRHVTLLQYVDLNNIYRPSFLIDASFFSVITAPAHSVMPHYARGFIVLIIWQQSPATFSVARHPKLIALYDQLRIMSWVISWVCPAPMFWYLTFRSIG